MGVTKNTGGGRGEDRVALRGRKKYPILRQVECAIENGEREGASFGSKRLAYLKRNNGELKLRRTFPLFKVSFGALYYSSASTPFLWHPSCYKVYLSLLVWPPAAQKKRGGGGGCGEGDGASFHIFFFSSPSLARHLSSVCIPPKCRRRYAVTTSISPPHPQIVHQ